MGLGSFLRRTPFLEEAKQDIPGAQIRDSELDKGDYYVPTEWASN